MTELIGYNTALALVGALLFGFSSGHVGAFVYLRKASLLSDSLAHATLPGLIIGFLVSTFWEWKKEFLGVALGCWDIRTLWRRRNSMDYGAYEIGI